MPDVKTARSPKQFAGELVDQRVVLRQCAQDFRVELLLMEPPECGLSCVAEILTDSSENHWLAMERERMGSSRSR